mgnify:CR=1 FL=1
MRCSAFLALRMKIVSDDPMVRPYPVRAMMAAVEQFVARSAHVDRATLEGWLPYALVHAAYVDMSLGRMRGSDDVRKGASKKAFAAMQEADGEQEARRGSRAASRSASRSA